MKPLYFLPEPQVPEIIIEGGIPGQRIEIIQSDGTKREFIKTLTMIQLNSWWLEYK